MSQKLQELYESTAEDIIFGIGDMCLPNGRPAPYIHIFYKDWSRTKLELVRDSFKNRLILVSAKRPDSTYHMFIATGEKITLRHCQKGHTSVLRAPTWSAHLDRVDATAVDHFEAQRNQYGGFLLLVQTPEWEFLTAVQDPSGNTVTGNIQPTAQPIPAYLQQ